MNVEDTKTKQIIQLINSILPINRENPNNTKKLIDNKNISNQSTCYFLFFFLIQVLLTKQKILSVWKRKYIV